MPTGDAISGVLAQLSQDWRLLAVFWHLYFLAFTTAVVLKWRPTSRQASAIMIAPLVSVVSLAWLSSNPFSTIMLGIVLIAALFMIFRLPDEKVSLATGPMVLAGVSLVLFGLLYPHFLGKVSFFTYLYAAPVGIVPCPTLAVIVGFSLVFNSLGARSWTFITGVPALFYGIFGTLYLGVTLDWVLSAGAVVLIASAWRPVEERN